MSKKEMVNTYQVIDNLLPKEEFNLLLNTVTRKNQFNWFYQDSVSTENDQDKSHFYFVHKLYENDSPISNYFYELQNIWKALKNNNHTIKTMIRAKVNLYTKTPQIIEHAMHKDFEFEHKGALFSLNSCDGYTLLEDGTKIDSVANRMLIFDASKNHASTSCTNQNVRMNINLNFF